MSNSEENTTILLSAQDANFHDVLIYRYMYPCYVHIYIYVCMLLNSFLKVFEIILDLQKSCKNSTEFSCILHPPSPCVNVLHNYRTFVKIKKLTSIQYYLLK